MLLKVQLTETNVNIHEYISWMKQLALKQIVYERTQNDCFQTSLNELELIKCFQDYGVGQTAAEYINGAFNGQKGFKAGQNLIFYIYNGKIWYSIPLTTKYDFLQQCSLIHYLGKNVHMSTKISYLIMIATGSWELWHLWGGEGWEEVLWV